MLHEITAGTALTARLFEALRLASQDPPGVSRASYGAGEAAAHALARAEAQALGLECHADPAGNLFMTLPGADRGLPATFIGSHLDAVPHAGNFDGAAGVVMGLAACASLRAHGTTLPRDLTVMAVRAEEMCWFPAFYLGSRAAFGLIPAQLPDEVRRSDSGRTLAEHMAEQGLDPDFLRLGQTSLHPARLHCFIEPHIEQGPQLAAAGIPVAVVTGIRGSLRHPRCLARGRWGHAGAEPRANRADAVLAAADLATALEAFWLAEEAAGRDLVLTLGEFHTPAAMHGPTKIPGELRFSLDIRSEDRAVLDAAAALLATRAQSIAEQRGVSLDYGAGMRVEPLRMAPWLRAALNAGAATARVPVLEMASGAGHDALIFGQQGVDCAMLFIRNTGGSHNPDEAMEPADFNAALAVLLAALPAICAA